MKSYERAYLPGRPLGGMTRKRRCRLRLPRRPHLLRATTGLNRHMKSHHRPPPMMFQRTGLGQVPRLTNRSHIRLVPRDSTCCPVNKISGMRDFRLRRFGGTRILILGPHLTQMMSYGRRGSRWTALMARHVLLQTRTMGPVTPGMNQHVWTPADMMLTFPP